MLRHCKIPPFAFAVLTSAAFSCLLSARCPAADDSAALKKIFAQPPREYSTAPLWVWNDMLTEDQVRLTMRDLAAQDVSSGARGRAKALQELGWRKHLDRA